MRVGKHFEFGYPNIQDRISYSWPNEEHNWSKLLKERKNELGKPLLEKFRRYITEFDLFTADPRHASLQITEDGLTLHLNDSGRWVEVWGMLGGFVSGHNLDSYRDRAVGFNIGSDTLEHLDPTILAPRILLEDGRYILRYPLPKGVEAITHSTFTETSLRNLYELVRLDPNIKITRESGIQRVENSHGVVTIANGACEGRGFEGWNVPKASFVISRIMSLCK